MPLLKAICWAIIFLTRYRKKTGSNHPPGCIEESMFFLEHTSPEEDLPGSSSKINQTEVKEILKVAKYLVKNDYRPEDITVLCAYRGQVVRMEDEFKKTSSDPTEESFTKLGDIKITTVDSFQGEENKVILLSLVRSNKKERIGFFAEQTRICVAVSRAQCALYFFGNATLYKGRSKDWKAIIDLLGKRKLIGTTFPFKDDQEMVMPEDASGQLLTPRLVGLIGSNTTTKWERLARLLNMEDAFVDDIRCNYAFYPDARSKAVKVLEMYKEDSKFDVTELVHWLKYLDIKVPDELKSKSSWQVSGQLLTPRLVGLIGSNTTTKWERLARLLNMEDAFVDDIRCNYALYPDAHSKAEKVVEKYKEDSKFDVTKLVHWLKYLDIKVPDELKAKSSWQGMKTKHSNKSTRYKDKFEKLLTLDSCKIQRIGPVHVCFDTEFLICKGRNSVYIGLHQDGSEVAVKRILSDKSSFEKEVGILDLVNLKKSNHTVNYRDFISDESDDFNYIILDLCEENLAEYIKKHDKEFLKRHGPVIIREILTGLQALHRGEKKVLHMDLKPRNILVDVEGHMRLTDFGVSRVLKNDETSVVTCPHGTEDWMAAESIPKNEDDDVRFKRKSDIQVAGMICFYVLTKGEHPFGVRHYRMQNIMNDSPVNLDKLTDPNAKRFVSWLISHEIKDRPYVDDALADCFLQVLPDIKEQVSDKTQLSPREIERLSSYIVSSWQRLAGLLNLFEKEVDDVLQSQLYPQPRQKAAKCLNLYNDKHEKFSRNDLAKYLEEVNLLQASKEVLDGTLRKI